MPDKRFKAEEIVNDGVDGLRPKGPAQHSMGCSDIVCVSKPEDP